MRQRVLIAQALAGNPRLLLADEPTTALDVTIQRQVLALIADLVARLRLTLLLISHDLGVIGAICRRVVVMYAGTIVEDAPSRGAVRRATRHPYTRGLLAAVPDLDASGSPAARHPRQHSLAARLRRPAAAFIRAARRRCRSAAPKRRACSDAAHRTACHAVAA